MCSLIPQDWWIMRVWKVLKIRSLLCSPSDLIPESLSLRPVVPSCLAPGSESSTLNLIYLLVPITALLWTHSSLKLLEKPKNADLRVCVHACARVCSFMCKSMRARQRQRQKRFRMHVLCRLIPAVAFLLHLNELFYTSRLFSLFFSSLQYSNNTHGCLWPGPFRTFN